MAHFEPWRIRILGFAKKGDFIYSISVNVIIQYVELTGLTNHRRVGVGGKLFSEVKFIPRHNDVQIIKRQYTFFLNLRIHERRIHL